MANMLCQFWSCVLACLSVALQPALQQNIFVVQTIENSTSKAKVMGLTSVNAWTNITFTLKAPQVFWTKSICQTELGKLHKEMEIAKLQTTL